MGLTLWQSNFQRQILDKYSPVRVTQHFPMTLSPGIVLKDTYLSYSTAQSIGALLNRKPSRPQVQRRNCWPYHMRPKRFYGGRVYSRPYGSTLATKWLSGATIGRHFG